MAEYYKDVVFYIDSLPDLVAEAEEYGLDDFLHIFKQDNDFSVDKRLEVLSSLVLFYGAPHLLT